MMPLYVIMYLQSQIWHFCRSGGNFEWPVALFRMFVAWLKDVIYCNAVVQIRYSKSNRWKCHINLDFKTTFLEFVVPVHYCKQQTVNLFRAVTFINILILCISWENSQCWEICEMFTHFPTVTIKWKVLD